MKLALLKLELNGESLLDFVLPVHLFFGDNSYNLQLKQLHRLLSKFVGRDGMFFRFFLLSL